MTTWEGLSKLNCPLIVSGYNGVHGTDGPFYSYLEFCDAFSLEIILFLCISGVVTFESEPFYSVEVPLPQLL